MKRKAQTEPEAEAEAEAEALDHSDGHGNGNGEANANGDGGVRSGGAQTNRKLARTNGEYSDGRAAAELIEAEDASDASSGEEEYGDIDKKASTNHAALAERRKCPYLDTVNRQKLDFDQQKVCSQTLTNLNVYACLVCGKYFAGR
jgi:hypothetical protein